MSTQTTASEVEITLPSGARVVTRAGTPHEAGTLAEATTRLVSAVETEAAGACLLRALPPAGGLPSVTVEARLGGWQVLDTVLRSIESLVGRPLDASVSLALGGARTSRRWRQGWAGA